MKKPIFGWIILCITLLGCSSKRLDSKQFLNIMEKEETKIRMVVGVDETFSSVILNDQDVLEKRLANFLSDEMVVEQKEKYIEEVLNQQQILIRRFKQFFMDHPFQPAKKPDTLLMNDQFLGIEASLKDETYYVSFFENGIVQFQQYEPKKIAYYMADQDEVNLIKGYLDMYKTEANKIGLSYLEKDQ